MGKDCCVGMDHDHGDHPELDDSSFRGVPDCVLGDHNRDEFPKSVKRRLDALRNLQLKYDEACEAFQKKEIDLHSKYFPNSDSDDNKEVELPEEQMDELLACIKQNEKELNEITSKIFEKRRTIVCGEYEPTDEECAFEDKCTCENPPEPDGDVLGTGPFVVVDDDSENPEKGIKDFWVTALKNHDEISFMLSDQDSEVLSHLIDIRSKESDENEITLEFEFEENEFFTNKVLTKVYKLNEEFALESSTGCKINWKMGQDYTNETCTAKLGPADLEEDIEMASFMKFFSPPTPEEDEEGCLADMDIGFEIKEEILAAAVNFYTGEVYGRCPVHGFLESDFADDDDDDEDDEDFSDADIEEIHNDEDVD